MTLRARIAWHAVPVLVAILTLATLKEIDTRFFPVITSFTITQQERTPAGITLQGALTKSRDCRFVEVVAYSDSHPVTLSFLDTKSTYSRTATTQNWGPWLIHTQAKHVTISARHQCHALWDHTTLLVDLTLP